ncbi:MAG: biotin--[acetyl-CoA-carboxylase] ligase [Ignavibacteria bacterium]|jgi:BirA family biotin operon repressor/biotin-[acetyl-CoA-carboxylase] ligase|nr:biotin--[acetyl-CoA-carboxylase] ligase [Ignavibacteria bacterium]HRI32086.1 biotin--[acetyl-CoA-carboxylase] ligase [Candidatus Kapabacteria bacterium]
MTSLIPSFFHLSSVTSTNDEARKLLNTSPFVIISADSQSKGRGRNGKTWLGNPHENLYLSIGITHQQHSFSSLPIALQASGSLLVLQLLHALAPQANFALKYPNDVYALYNGKQSKIAGILVENDYLGSSLHSTIIGIGLNIAQENFPDSLQAVSLHMLGIHSTPADIITKLYNLIPPLLSEAITYPAITLKRWEETLNIEGKAISILNSGQTGIAQGLSDDGHLIVALPPFVGETLTITNGDSVLYDLF